MAIDLPSVIGATAAAFAAVLAGLNLLLSIRHERTRWIRETLVEAYVDYLSASTERSRISGMAISSRRAGEASAALAALREQSEAVHSRHIDLLTRLRILAAVPVIRAAQELHDCDDRLAKLAF